MDIEHAFVHLLFVSMSQADIRRILLYEESDLGSPNASNEHASGHVQSYLVV